MKRRRCSSRFAFFANIRGLSSSQAAAASRKHCANLRLSPNLVHQLLMPCWGCIWATKTNKDPATACVFCPLSTSKVFGREKPLKAISRLIRYAKAWFNARGNSPKHYSDYFILNLLFLKRSNALFSNSKQHVELWRKNLARIKASTYYPENHGCEFFEDFWPLQLDSNFWLLDFCAIFVQKYYLFNLVFLLILDKISQEKSYL